MATGTQVEPIRKAIELECPAEHAWEVFTQRMTDWWPLSSYSLAAGQEGVRTEEVVFEPRVGGRVYERLSSGEEGEWAVVRVWDPPRRLVLTWHPGNPLDTEVDLRFTSLSGDRCRVELEHRGWENLGDEALRTREGYVNGWITVWELYTRAAVAR